mmetsp:Transcript_26520/g.60444  ORF Transcript_26520/g.60444 Transcript_26520/m.60444 type:complete len:220 (-) Transcript_26520:1365-2024(-)
MIVRSNSAASFSAWREEPAKGAPAMLRRWGGRGMSAGAAGAATTSNVVSCRSLTTSPKIWFCTGSISPSSVAFPSSCASSSALGTGSCNLHSSSMSRYAKYSLPSMMSDCFWSSAGSVLLASTFCLPSSSSVTCSTGKRLSPAMKTAIHSLHCLFGTVACSATSLYSTTLHTRSTVCSTIFLHVSKCFCLRFASLSSSSSSNRDLSISSFTKYSFLFVL